MIAKPMMPITTWIVRRLPADHARHVVCCAVIALAAAHLAALVGVAPWLAALLSAFVVGGALELIQWRSSTGHPSWNDMAANVAGGALVALGTLA